MLYKKLMEKEAEILDQIRKKHSLLSPEEQSLLAQLVLNIKDVSGVKFQEAKDRFMSHLEADLYRFFSWNVQPMQRSLIRDKFLNIAGLYNVVPHQEILNMLARVGSQFKRPISDVLPEDLFGKETEIDAVNLKHLSPFAEVLNVVEKTVGVTYLDFISGNRELGIPPIIHSILFGKNIALNHSEENYLSASSEVFTKTVYVSTHTSPGKKRDYISMGYDLITQSSFVDFFYSIEKDFNINKVLRNSMIIGTRFVEAMILWLESEFGNPRYRELFDQLAGEDNKYSLETFLEDYLVYLETELMDQNINLVAQLNEKLGLAKDDFKVHM